MGNRIGEALGSIQNPYIKNFTVDASVLDNIDYISEIRKCYCQRHVDDKLDTMLYGIRNTERKEYWKMFKMDKVKKVIFNPPATIVYWFDGTKTIVKAQDGEVFDTEKGFAMACTKKFFGNEGNYYKEFRKHGADNRCLSISIDLARTGEFVKSGIEDGILNEVREEFRAGFDKCREIDHKFEELSKLEDYASKSKYIVKRVKEELSNSHWGLKLYVDPDTKPNILDMVIFNDSGKSLRSMCDFDIVELEKLDDAVKTIMKDVRERCI